MRDLEDVLVHNGSETSLPSKEELNTFINIKQTYLFVSLQTLS